MHDGLIEATRSAATCVFGRPDSAHRGDNLPVEVRGIHRVGVDEIERPHPAASQRLHRIAAHSANAEHGHPSRRQAVEPVLPQQQPRPREEVIHEHTPIFPEERRVSNMGALAKSFAKWSQNRLLNSS